MTSKVIVSVTRLDEGCAMFCGKSSVMIEIEA